MSDDRLRDANGRGKSFGSILSRMFRDGISVREALDIPHDFRGRFGDDYPNSPRNLYGNRAKHFREINATARFCLLRDQEQSKSLSLRVVEDDPPDVEIYCSESRQFLELVAAMPENMKPNEALKKGAAAVGKGDEETLRQQELDRYRSVLTDRPEFFADFGIPLKVDSLDRTDEIRLIASKVKEQILKKARKHKRERTYSLLVHSWFEDKWLCHSLFSQEAIWPNYLQPADLRDAEIFPDIYILGSHPSDIEVLTLRENFQWLNPLGYSRTIYDKFKILV